MKLVTVQSNHNKRPLKMRGAKEDIYTRACSIPSVRFEDQELTSFGGIVVFQKLFAKLNLKEHLRRCCAHLAEKNLYHPAVIVQWLIVHLLLGFRKLRDLEFYEDDPLIKRVLGLKVLPDVSRSEEHTSELQSPCNLVCRLLLEKKKNYNIDSRYHSRLMCLQSN